MRFLYSWPSWLILPPCTQSRGQMFQKSSAHQILLVLGPQGPAKWKSCSPSRLIFPGVPLHTSWGAAKRFDGSQLCLSSFFPVMSLDRSTSVVPETCVLSLHVDSVQLFKNQNSDSLLNFTWKVNTIVYVIVFSRGVTKGQATHCHGKIIYLKSCFVWSLYKKMNEYTVPASVIAQEKFVYEPKWT